MIEKCDLINTRKLDYRDLEWLLNNLESLTTNIDDAFEKAKQHDNWYYELECKARCVLNKNRENAVFLYFALISTRRNLHPITPEGAINILNDISMFGMPIYYWDEDDEKEMFKSYMRDAFRRKSEETWISRES